MRNSTTLRHAATPERHILTQEHQAYRHHRHPSEDRQPQSNPDVPHPSPSFTATARPAPPVPCQLYPIAAPRTKPPPLTRPSGDPGRTIRPFTRPPPGSFRPICPFWCRLPLLGQCHIPRSHPRRPFCAIRDCRSAPVFRVFRDPDPSVALDNHPKRIYTIFAVATIAVSIIARSLSVRRRLGRLT